jgi:RNA recognition motif-containing protein
MSSRSRESKGKSPSNSTKEIKKINKIFITNMSSLLSLPEIDSKLRALFSKYGEILELQCKENQAKRYSYAFLEMKDPAIIPKIIEEYNGYEFEGRKLKV